MYVQLMMRCQRRFWWSSLRTQPNIETRLTYSNIGISRCFELKNGKTSRLVMVCRSSPLTSARWVTPNESPLPLAPTSWNWHSWTSWEANLKEKHKQLSSSELSQWSNVSKQPNHGLHGHQGWKPREQLGWIDTSGELDVDLIRCNIKRLVLTRFLGGIFRQCNHELSGRSPS